MIDETSESQARELLGRHVGGAANIPPRAQRGKDSWFFTYDSRNGSPAPPGSPSWLVLDDGTCASVGTRETPAEVLARLRAQ